ncbi:MAG: hypothetical protein ACRDIB_11315, partial [Ardenticatenaceae bacterium]
GLAVALYGMGLAESVAGSYESAESWLSESMTIAHETDNQRIYAFAMGVTGYGLIATGRIGEARKRAEQARAIVEQIGHPHDRVSFIPIIVDAVRLEGDLDHASALLCESYQAIVEHPFRVVAVVGLAMQAELWRSYGKLEKALRLYTFLLRDPTADHWAFMEMRRARLRNEMAVHYSETDIATIEARGRAMTWEEAIARAED